VRVALLTCAELPRLAPDGPPPDLDSDSDVLLPALEALGAQAEPAVWTDADLDLSRFDAAVLRSTWDYHERAAEFREWVARAATQTELWNRPGTVAWNMDKRYLRELEQAGVPVVPTLWADGGDDVERPLRERGWSEVVVKPAVDLGARNLLRTDAAGAALEVRGRAGHLLVQPYLPSLEAEGELSLAFVDGELLHAVRKSPAAGDFRVQPQYGGSAEVVEPAAEQVEVARRALGCAPEPWLYARVDMVHGLEGRPCVIELELIEPLLFLAHSPGSADVFARAICARAERATTPR
jgi:glutathione synthase/RimK-type ligase-like ATP-grasp enzyme